MFPNIGYPEIFIILLVVLVLFGGSQLPRIARNMGQAGKELKKANKDLKEAITEKKS